MPDDQKNGTGKKETSPTGKKRLKSLDTFTGISMAILIFVNDGSGGYYFFDHSTWNGLYVADLAFPWYIMIQSSIQMYIDVKV